MSAVVHSFSPPWWLRLIRRFGWGWEHDDLGRKRRGTWCQTYSGQKFWPLDPRADEVHLDDLVVGGARECRYGRQTTRFYSVLEHELIVSLAVEKFARERGWDEATVLLAAREGLMHDSSEAIIGDMIRPIKHQPIMRGYRRAEAPIAAAAYERFGIVPTEATSALVKEVDDRIVVDEINSLMRRPEMYLSRYADVEPLGVTIAALPWEQAAAAWLVRFDELWPGWLDRECPEWSAAIALEIEDTAS